MTRSQPSLRAALAALSGAAVPTWAHAQLAGGGAAPEVDYLRVLAAIALCLGLAVLAIWWLKNNAVARLGLATGKESGRTLRIVETARLHVRATLYVVEFDGRRILVSADPNGVVRLAEGREQQTTDAVSR